MSFKKTAHELKRKVFQSFNARRAFVSRKLKKYLDDVDCLVETLSAVPFRLEMGTKPNEKI